MAIFDTAGSVHMNKYPCGDATVGRQKRGDELHMRNTTEITRYFIFSLIAEPKPTNCCWQG